MRRLLLSLAALLASCAALAADPALPFLDPLFGEHMMLQRDRPNPVWGWAQAGTKVTVAFAGQTKSAVTAADGRWQVALDPLAASIIPQEFTLTSSNRESKIENRKFQDVLVGDIWLCSGQSNMGFGLSGSRDGAEAVKQSTHEGIRLFVVPQKSAYAPGAAPAGSWRRCEPASFTGFPGFSAVAYYFARKVHAETGVPIGLIQAAIGGTPAETWTSAAGLRDFPEFAPGLAQIAGLRERGAPVYGNYVMHWYDEFDRGVAGRWFEEKLDDHAWAPTSLHNVFAQLGVPTTPAVVWLRREVVLPDPLPEGRARVLLGVVEKMDTVWINGQQFGASAWVENPRSYADFRGILRPGRNQLAVRVLKTVADGGFRSPSGALQLQLGNGASIPLEEGWRAALGLDARPPQSLPLGYENWPNMPTVLYEGMLHPLAPMAMTGVLWYQGEANATRARQYRTLLPAMIADWRALFGRPDLPFYIASLPVFEHRKDQPGIAGWAGLREAQMFTARTVPHTGVAITIDTGDADNLHPTEKLPVGERLGLLALRDVYGKDVVSSGPVFERAETLPSALRLHFTHTDGGLVTKGDTLGEFSVAGADHAWHWAQARLDGDTVIVSAAAVPAPVAVRYAWQSNPLATLFNGAGLPAAPFRTDDWPEDKKP